MNFAAYVLIGMGIMVVIIFCVLYFGKLDEDEYYISKDKQQLEDEITKATIQYYKKMLENDTREKAKLKNK